MRHRSRPLTRTLGSTTCHSIKVGDEGQTVNLDRVTTHGTLRASPHGLMQGYLNATPEHLWGLVTNGETLRLRLRVAAAEDRHMHGQPGVEGERLERVPHERTGEVSADEVVLVTRGLARVDEVRTTADVDHGLRERLVERHEGVAVARDARLVAERLAVEHKPKMLVGGFSAYSQVVDWKRMREIADKVGAIFFVDMAHVAGLIAAGVYPSPVPHAHVVTSTTHKTLLGPRGGIIIAKNPPEEIAKKLQSIVQLKKLVANKQRQLV